jgi:hypothetical protein
MSGLVCYFDNFQFYALGLQMFHDQVEITAGGFFVVDVRLIFCVSYLSSRIFPLPCKIMVDHCRLWNSHGRRVAVVDIRQTRLLPCVI